VRLIVEKEVSKFRVERWSQRWESGGLQLRKHSFPGLPVPKENLLGEEGKGFRIANGGLDAGRPTIAAQAVGLAQGRWKKPSVMQRRESSLARPISDFQGIQ